MALPRRGTCGAPPRDRQTRPGARPASPRREDYPGVSASRETQCSVASSTRDYSPANASMSSHARAIVGQVTRPTEPSRRTPEASRAPSPGPERYATWRGRRGRESQGPSPRIYMYTPLVGSGELDHKRRHVVPRPQPQRTSDQLRAALGGRLAGLQETIHHTNRLLAVQHVPETVRS